MKGEIKKALGHIGISIVIAGVTIMPHYLEGKEIDEGDKVLYRIEVSLHPDHLEPRSYQPFPTTPPKVVGLTSGVYLNEILSPPQSEGNQFVIHYPYA